MSNQNTNNNTSGNLATAATLMTLSVSLRCVRDFRYYRCQTPESPTREKLKETVNRLISNTHSLHNLLSNTNRSAANAFFYILGRMIHDDLETLHRDLLFFDPDLIVDVIPSIDEERRFWNSYNSASFYNNELCFRLDHNVPAVLQQIRKQVEKLEP